MESKPRFGLREHPPIRMEFSDPRGKDREVTILSTEHIGRGGVGDIYRAKVEVEGSGERTRTGIYVLKDIYTRQRNKGYSEEEARRRAVEAVESSVAMHKKLKETEGIATWTTYRPNAEKTAILMTDGESTEDDYLLGFGNSSESSTKVQKSIEKLHNIEEAVQNGIRTVLEASRRNIILRADVWFARFRKGTEPTVSFFIGDLDSFSMLLLSSHANPQQSLAMSNLYNFAAAASGLLDVALKDVHEAIRIRAYINERIGAAISSL